MSLTTAKTESNMTNNESGNQNRNLPTNSHFSVAVPSFAGFDPTEVDFRGGSMQEFLDWLEHNADHLKTYSIHEIVDVAIASGQDRIAVTQWATRERFRHVA